MAEAAEQSDDGSLSCNFLVVAYGIQGHLNPARSLARRLAGIDGVTATLSVQVFGHRRLFPSSSGDEEVSDGVISYIPFSDGLDDGTWPSDSDEDRERYRRASIQSLSSVVRRLAGAGRPVTCVVCTLNMPAVVEVARAHGLALAMYWIQPATALAAYYHYFHGHAEDVASHAADLAHEAALPGLRRPLRIRDMPSFIVDDATGGGNGISKMVLQGFRQLFEQMDEEGMMVLVNTLEALEATALEAIRPYLDAGVFAVGVPAVPLPGAGKEDDRVHLFKQDQKSGYMAWLDARPARSVVYVSSGSILTYSAREAEEILLGLRRLARPYLWVVRREGRSPEVDRLLLEEAEAAGTEGVVVEWCDQVRVLSHPSVACFVTHCGWSSTLEAVACGVPVVAAPSWSDQPVNAHLLEEEWGVGVRAERDADGALTGAELARCVELVVGGGEMAEAIAANVRVWKGKAREAVAAGGPSERSLRSFVKMVQDLDEFARRAQEILSTPPSCT
ncbi:cyanidin 3-O-rutinoside 5-O-glucosyltransferase-like [Lolium rigidum]|uniref:cyanidin 3-O-rutinoside 5-O-glucosyltransferase-like n=1 Tax=Lolium rigidum TaxID=89674 RepID=UPI001F5C819C|nr:cyanidin 3-O-rutinoside 5-O-glucosyltransferase-like [Lolium rigidum]